MKKFAITSSAEIAVDSNTGYSEISTHLQLLGMALNLEISLL